MTEPALKLNYLSHGTLECRDIDKTREFYEGFLGLDVVQTSPRSLMIRLGGSNTIATVLSPKKQIMALLNHNGLDVATREEVDRAHAICTEQQERWGIKSVTRPSDQHGTYSFYLRDLDDNWWEILTNPKDGYAWMFAKGGDIRNWGAGEAQGFNPNDFTGRRRG
jgi:catechol 2,3-dioxygenase-like lactoylglutathione lyase family enzyme